MRKNLYIFVAAVLLFTGCSKNSLFPTDTKVYDSPDNYRLQFETYDFNSSQTSLLKGWWFRATGRPKGMVVVANGMRYNMSERFKEWTWLLGEGYDLFIFDYRGYGESTGEVDMHGFVDDVTAAIAFAHTLNEELPMVAVGQSMGGSFVIDAVAKKEYPYVKLLVIDSTMSSFSASAEEIMDQYILLWPWSWVPSNFTPTGVDSIEFVDKTETATLFLAGLKDEVVQPKHSVELFLQAKEPKAIWIVEGAGHVECIHNPKVKEALLETIERVLGEASALPCEVRYYEHNATEE